MTAMPIIGILFVAFGLYLYCRRDNNEKDRSAGALFILIGIVIAAGCKGY